MKFSPAHYSLAGLLVLYVASAHLFFFHDLGYNELQRKYVMGLHGVEMLVRDAEAPVSFEPWESQERNLSLSRMLELLCNEAGLERNCHQESSARFRIFTKDHVVTVGGETYRLERNTTPIALSSITPAFLDERMALIAQWAKSNQRSDGSFPYLYAPSTDTYQDLNNSIRQLLAIQGLFAVAKDLNDSDLLQVAFRAEKNIFDELYREDGRGSAYIADYDGQVPLGATAIAILMMREHENAPTAREIKMAEYILSMQRSDGSFQTFMHSATSTRDEQFYSGEALMALAKLDLVSDDLRYGEALRRGYEYYSEKLRNDFMPQYTPWHIQAYATAYEKTPDEKYAKYVYWLADGLIETMLNHDPRARADEVGRFYNPEYPQWGPPHSASTSIYLEGIAYAYKLAKPRGDERKINAYRDAFLKSTRSLLLVQWTPESAYYLAEPEKVVGAFKVTITDNRFRVDQMGHTANALVQVKEALE